MNKNPKIASLFRFVLCFICIGLSSCLYNLNKIEKQYSQANQLFESGQHAEAIKLFEKTLALERETYGDKHISTNLNNLANLYCELGEYAK